MPGGGAVFQFFLGGFLCRAFQLVAEPPGRVGRGVEVVVGGQQPAFLGEQQEDDPHHHRDRGAVDVVRGGDAVQPVAAGFAGAQVVPADRVDQLLDRATDLHAERLGDFLLVLQALVQQHRQGLGCGYGEEPAAVQQRDERADHDPVGGLRPGHRVEHRRGRHPATGRPDQRPPAAVGDQAERHVVVAAQQRGRSTGVAAQVSPGIRPPGWVPGGQTSPSSRRAPVCVSASTKLGSMRASCSGTSSRQRGHPVAADGVAPAEQSIEDKVEPAGRLVAGAGVCGPQRLAGGRLDRVQGGPDPAQHRQGQERPGDLDHGQPVQVFLPAVHRPRAAAPADHRVTSRRGTTKTTATGNRCGCGSA